MKTPRCILFDFDGTLVDSAPDLAGASNDLRNEHNLPALPYEALRPFATYGAKSLLKAALDIDPTHDEFELKRKRFLAIYDSRKLQESHLFDGVLELLIGLERRGITWGVVTNKLSRLAEPMVFELLRDKAFNPVTLVCGDSTKTPKPSPAPLFLAASDANMSPEDCWYVGDGENDILAAKAAGMSSVLASYGYIPDTKSAKAWGADLEIAKPLDLLKFLPEWTMATA